jgi:hypothetical protein
MDANYKGVRAGPRKNLLVGGAAAVGLLLAGSLAGNMWTSQDAAEQAQPVANLIEEPYEAFESFAEVLDGDDVVAEPADAPVSLPAAFNDAAWDKYAAGMQAVLELVQELGRETAAAADAEEDLTELPRVKTPKGLLSWKKISDKKIKELEDLVVDTLKEQGALLKGIQAGPIDAGKVKRTFRWVQNHNLHFKQLDLDFNAFIGFLKLQANSCLLAQQDMQAMAVSMYINTENAVDDYLGYVEELREAEDDEDRFDAVETYMDYFGAMMKTLTDNHALLGNTKRIFEKVQGEIQTT